MSHSADSAHGAVVLIDGVCNLCNATARFVAKRDRENRFRFAPLQSSTGRRMLQTTGHQHLLEEIPARTAGRRGEPDGPRSIVLVEGSTVSTRSTAALRIARGLGGAYPLLYALIVVPRPIRDWFYDAIARRRYRWFGRTGECQTPPADLRDRFLD